MYNGIGLETARGSGTNGYVQRNLSFIRRHKDKVDYKSEEELKKLDSQLTKGPNKDILDHERKRKIELKCMEMQELMEEQGYADEEIEHKVSVFRQMLMEKDQGDDITVVEKDDAGRPIAKATHQISEANQIRNQQLKAAFGLSEFYQDGTAMDPQRKAKEEAAKALAIAQKKYALVPDEEEKETDGNVHQSESKSKRKHKQVDSEMPEKKKRQHTSEAAESERKHSHKHSSVADDEKELDRKRHHTSEGVESERKHSHKHSSVADDEKELDRKRHHTSAAVESERKHSHKHSSVADDEKEFDRKRRHGHSSSPSVSRKKKRLSRSRSRSADDKNEHKKSSRSKSSPSTSKKHGSKKHHR